jgi:crotonobetainyl-CoA:carnitine CoA-transferase CaiB-like acyl-CoA transferase
MSGRGLTPVLTGRRVVEHATGSGAPYAGRVLADLGAEVVKVEPPGGDPLRTDRPGAFRYLNLGKRSAALDVTGGGADAFARLLATADAVLVDRDSPVLGRPGLRAAVPATAVVAAVTPYGLSGPRRDDRAGARVLFHESGGSVIDMRMAVADGTAPVAPCSELAWLDAGCAAALGVLAFLAGAPGRSTADGPAVLDVSAQDAGALLMRQDLCTFPNEGISVSPRALVMAGPYGTLILTCADGYVLSHVGPEDWVAWCALIGRPDAGAQPLFTDIDRRTADIELSTAVIDEWTGVRPWREVEQAAQAVGLAAACVRTPAEVRSDPQLRHRGFFRRVRDGAGAVVEVAEALPFVERTAAGPDGYPTGDVGTGAPPLDDWVTEVSA